MGYDVELGIGDKTEEDEFSLLLLLHVNITVQ
jgi:hypothetical protein